MKQRIHQKLNRFCERRVAKKQTDDLLFRLFAWLEFKLRAGKSKWRYGAIETQAIALTPRAFTRKYIRPRTRKLLRRIRTANGDWSGRY